MRMAKHRGKITGRAAAIGVDQEYSGLHTHQNPNDVLDEVSNFYLAYLLKRNVRENCPSIDSLTMLSKGHLRSQRGRHPSHMAEARKGMCPEEILMRSVRFPRTFPLVCTTAAKASGA